MSFHLLLLLLLHWGMLELYVIRMFNCIHYTIKGIDSRRPIELCSLGMTFLPSISLPKKGILVLHQKFLGASSLRSQSQNGRHNTQYFHCNLLSTRPSGYVITLFSIIVRIYLQHYPNILKEREWMWVKITVDSTIEFFFVFFLNFFSYGEI